MFIAMCIGISRASNLILFNCAQSKNQQFGPVLKNWFILKNDLFTGQNRMVYGLWFCVASTKRASHLLSKRTIKRQTWMLVDNDNNIDF